MNHPAWIGSKRLVRCYAPCLVAVLAGIGLATRAAEVPAAPEPKPAAAGESTPGTVLRTPGGGKVVITAKSVLYDFAKRVAQFESNVSVSDEQVMLTADRMDVFLTAENAVQRVEAIGNVVIREMGTAKKATAGKAVYDMSQDTVVLTEAPYLEERDQGFSTRGAERIIYYRAQQQFKAEGENVQIEFGVKNDGSRSATDLFRPKDSAKGTDAPGGAQPAKPETTAP